LLDENANDIILVFIMSSTSGIAGHDINTCLHRIAYLFSASQKLKRELAAGVKESPSTFSTSKKQLPDWP